MRLDVAGLEPSTDGEFYEAWLLGKDGPHAVPAGSEKAGDDVLPLSPVLILPVDRAELVRAYHSSVPGNAPATDPFMKP